MHLKGISSCKVGELLSFANPSGFCPLAVSTAVMDLGDCGIKRLHSTGVVELLGAENGTYLLCLAHGIIMIEDLKADSDCGGMDAATCIRPFCTSLNDSRNEWRVPRAFRGAIHAFWYDLFHEFRKIGSGISRHLSPLELNRNICIYLPNCYEFCRLNRITLVCSTYAPE